MFRAVPPEETVRRAKGIGRALGITRVANVTGLDDIGIPVVMVCRPNARSLAVSQGKGVTLPAAEASGLMESLELYHAERITLPLKLASYDELRFTHRVADVTALPRPPAGQFRDDLRMLWIEGEDLLQGGTTWLPFELVHIDCTRPAHPGAGAFSCSSNGLASGNTAAEATIHAITEVIEREGLQQFSLLPADEQDWRRLRLETVDDPDACGLLERFSRAHVDVAVWDTTESTGIPSFTCDVAAREDAPRARAGTFSGGGCHPSRAVALCRALTEAAQTRLTLITGARDDLSRAFYESEAGPERARRERARRNRSAPALSFRDVPGWAGDDLDAAVVWLLERVAGGGYPSVLRVDLTKEEFGIPVARVVIPGTSGVGGLAPNTPVFDA